MLPPTTCTVTEEDAEADCDGDDDGDGDVHDGDYSDYVSAESSDKGGDGVTEA